MKVADLAHDVTYLETISKAVANTSASLVNDVLDLKARIEALPAIITDVRIGPGEYHACPKDPAPMVKLIDIVKAGGLVLVENSSRVLYRLMEYDAEHDQASVTPLKNEMGRVAVPKATVCVSGYLIYLKLNA